MRFFANLAFAASAFLATLVASSANAAPPVVPARIAPIEADERPPDRTEPAAPHGRAPSSSEFEPSRRVRARWLLSLEGVVHAPSDLGVQAGVEAPVRVRVFTGFGYMPIEWLTSFAARASDDRDTRLVLDVPSYRGTIWRTQLGFRPFPRSGFYFDAGYARATLHGSVDLGSSLLAREADLEGGYSVRAVLDVWLLELGHQWRIDRRGVLALGGGVMSTFNARTSVRAHDGAPTDERIPDGAERANQALERYGTLPMLTLRLGVDLI